MKRAMVNNWNRFFCIRLHSPCANSFFHMNLHLHFFEGRGRYYLTWHCVFCLIGFGQFERRSSARCQHVVRTVNQCLESSHLPALSVPTHLIWLVFLLASRSVAWLPFVYALAYWHFTNYLALNIRHGGCGRADTPGAFFPGPAQEGNPHGGSLSHGATRGKRSTAPVI